MANSATKSTHSHRPAAALMPLPRLMLILTMNLTMNLTLILTLMSGCGFLRHRGAEADPASGAGTGTAATEVDGGVEGDTSADPPGEVTGTFLTGCGAYPEFAGAAGKGFGCGLFDAATGARYEGQISKVKVEITLTDGTVRLPRLKVPLQACPWHVAFSLQDATIAAIKEVTFTATAGADESPLTETLPGLDFEPPAQTRLSVPTAVTIDAAVLADGTVAASDDPGLLPPDGLDATGVLAMPAGQALMIGAQGSETPVTEFEGTCVPALGVVRATVAGVDYTWACLAGGTWTGRVAVGGVTPGQMVGVSLSQGVGDSLVTATGNLVARFNLTVGPLYPGPGDRWLDFVQTANPTNACAGATEANPEDCLHAGERRSGLIADTDLLCPLIQIQDQLDAFAWECHQAGRAIKLVSLGLKPGKRLGDLLTASPAPGWRLNALVIRSMGSGAIVAASPPEVWWTNPVKPLPDSAAAPVTLGATDGGTVFVQTAAADTKGLRITGDRIAVVAPAGSVMAVPTVAGTWGLRSTGATNCAVAVVGDYNWVDLSLAGAPATPTDYGIILQGAFARLDHVSLTGFAKAGIVLDNASYASVTDVMTYSNALSGLEVNRVAAMGKGRHRLTGVRSHNNGGDGLLIATDDTGLSLSLGSFSNNGGAGIKATDASGLNLNRVLSVANQGAGIQLIRTYEWVVQGATLALNGASGLDVPTDAFGGRGALMAIASLGNGGAGLVVNSNISTGYLRNLATGAGAGENLYIRSMTANPCGVYYFQESNAGTYSCDLLGDMTNALNATCDEQGGVGDFASFKTTELASAFAHTNLKSDPYSPALFATQPAAGIYRAAWGRAVTLPAVMFGRCAAGSCGLWDWRLATTSKLREGNPAVPAAGDACPWPVRGDRSAWFTIPQSSKYLLDAVEAVRDFRGDDDGLCESGEACVYLQSIGADTLLPDFGAHAKTCVFDGFGQMSAVTMYAP